MDEATDEVADTTTDEATDMATDDKTEGDKPAKGCDWKRLLRARYIVPLIIAVIGCVWSISAMNDGATRIERMTSSAYGTIVDIREYTSRDDGKKETTYRPVVRFEDSDGIEHETKSLYASKHGDRYYVGKGVGISYDPRDADGGCILAGEEKLAGMQNEGKGPLGIVIALAIAFIAYIALP